ncbi:MAG TPA: zinc carboxypeptidase, partial [Sphingobacteriaceae bacterium]
SFYNSVRNVSPDPLAFTREHPEPWPGGRSNHYYFDLNRDWAWQSQKETQARMALYNRWLPHVHVDFHEQGINDPYYFAPAAEPFHEVITSWQREFQTTIGKSNAKYFDDKGWMYFTKERFDLLYPSYGDTYPIYNGSVGMTFEQGGSGRAGLAVITNSGDTLTLADRIAHHHTTGLSTIEVASQHADKVVKEFRDYFTKSRTKPEGLYKSYIIKATNPEKLKDLAMLLERNGIRFGYGVSRTARGFNYFSGKTESFTVDKNDMIISAYQPKSILAKVLFEPETVVTDSNTYDITAWALPYAYGLPAFATADVIKPVTETPLPASGDIQAQSAVAYAAEWNSVADVKFLASLLKQNIKVRYAEVPFESGGRKFGAGSLIITRTGNESQGSRFDQQLQQLAAKWEISLHPVASGMVDRGADLGSGKVRFITKPKIALVLSDETSSLAYGEIWHFFEQQIGYPVSAIRSKDIPRISLGEFNVLIFPDGNYSEIGGDKVADWVRSGGKLIALESAVAQLVGKKGFNIKFKDNKRSEKEKDPYSDLKRYETRERDYIRSSIPGAIYKVNLDNTHPLGFGFPDFYYTLKLDDRVYDFMSDGWNVGVFKKNNYVTGFVGQNVKQKLVDGLIFGVQDMGSGSVVYLADDPLFRSFWENGKLLFSNAVFMVGH